MNDLKYIVYIGAEPDNELHGASRTVLSLADHS